VPSRHGIIDAAVENPRVSNAHIEKGPGQIALGRVRRLEAHGRGLGDQGNIRTCPPLLPSDDTKRDLVSSAHPVGAAHLGRVHKRFPPVSKGNEAEPLCRVEELDLAQLAFPLLAARVLAVAAPPSRILRQTSLAKLAASARHAHLVPAPLADLLAPWQGPLFAPSLFRKTATLSFTMPKGRSPRK